MCKSNTPPKMTPNKCMVKYDEDDTSAKLLIYSFLQDSDDKTKVFEAWKPKQFIFEPIWYEQYLL